jgi:hypothetical protein
MERLVCLIEVIIAITAQKLVPTVCVPFKKLANKGFVNFTTLATVSVYINLRLSAVTMVTRNAYYWKKTRTDIHNYCGKAGQVTLTDFIWKRINSDKKRDSRT